VIVVDANLLIYAYNSGSEKRAASKEWLEQVLSDQEPVGFPWAVIHAFLRLTTARVVLPRPLDMRDAISIVQDWFAASNTRILEPGPRYWPIFGDLLRKAEITGKMVSDAHLAALAIEHDATLFTTDRDFRRFEGLRWRNPLV
jgi:toxin-antitoxin system PIN domain toxin